MARGFPFIFKFGSKFVLEVLPSVAATVLGGYLLAQLHFSRTPEPTPTAQAAVTQTEAPTVREERAAMREVLKARREKVEAPAQVRIKVESQPLPAAMDSIDPKDARPANPAKESASRPTVAALPPPPPARREVELPRPRPDVAAAPAAAAPAYEPAPPVGAVSEPAQLAPVTVTANEPPAVQAMPERRGPVRAVFSAFSEVVGQAVNVTGDTVNWVIDLPGKAISAGGRLIGGTPPAPPARPFSNG